MTAQHRIPALILATTLLITGLGACSNDSDTQAEEEIQIDYTATPASEFDSSTMERDDGSAILTQTGIGDGWDIGVTIPILTGEDDDGNPLLMITLDVVNSTGDEVNTYDVSQYVTAVQGDDSIVKHVEISDETNPLYEYYEDYEDKYFSTLAADDEVFTPVFLELEDATTPVQITVGDDTVGIGIEQS